MKERIYELWSKTYNNEGKPDWSHIFPYYHEQVVYEDSIQRIEGIGDFKAMCALFSESLSTIEHGYSVGC